MFIVWNQRSQQGYTPKHTQLSLRTNHSPFVPSLHKKQTVITFCRTWGLVKGQFYSSIYLSFLHGIWMHVSVCRENLHGIFTLRQSHICLCTSPWTGSSLHSIMNSIPTSTSFRIILRRITSGLISAKHLSYSYYQVIQHQNNLRNMLKAMLFLLIIILNNPLTPNLMFLLHLYMAHNKCNLINQFFKGLMCPDKVF